MTAPMLWMLCLVVGGLVAILAYPLFAGRETWDLDEAPDRLRHFKRSRDRALRTLKDIDEDYREGTLLKEDYQEIRDTYKREAIRVSKELHRVREAVIRRIAEGPGEHLSGKERQKLEAMVAQRKKRIHR